MKRFEEIKVKENLLLHGQKGSRKQIQAWKA